MYEKKDLEIFQNLPVLVLVKSKNGQYIWVNRAWTQSTGQKLEDVVGKNDQEVFGEKNAAAFEKVDRQVLGSGETFMGQEHLSLEDGTVMTAMVCKFVAELDGEKCLFGIAMPMIQ